MKKTLILTSLIPAMCILALALTAVDGTQLETSSTVSDEVLASEMLPGEPVVLPWQPAFLIDSEMPEMSTENQSVFWGVCTQTCWPCRSNADCPPFLGLHQKCWPYCP